MSELPRNWVSCPVGTFSKSTSSLDPSRFPDEVFELYSVPSYLGGYPELVAGKEIKSNKQTVEPYDVLLCKIVPHINRVWLVGPYSGRRQIASGEWIVYRSEIVDSNYLRHLLSAPGFRTPFLGTVSGVGGSLMRARPALVHDIEIPIAPSPEQSRIASKLNRLLARSGRARHELDLVPELIERYKQAILAKAFTGELTADWRAANGMPKHWGEATVGTLATDIRYGTAAKCNYDVTSTAVLRIPNIGRSEILLDDLKYATFTSAEITKLSLMQGDLLFIRSNGSIGLVGRAAVVTIREAGLLYAGYLIRVRLDQQRVLPKFILHLFSEPKTRSDIENLAKSTSGVNNINSEQLSAIIVPLPTVDEQQEIIRRVDAASDWIDRIATECGRADRMLPKLEQAILGKAFRGELVPQDPNDEPASFLLDRIQAEREPAGEPRRQRRRAG